MDKYQIAARCHWVGCARRASGYVLRALREGMPGVADLYRSDIRDYMAKARAA